MQVTSEGPPVTRVKVSQCVVCFKVLDNSTTFQCSRCHSGKYCSRGCQKDDWENHKVLCSAITQLNDQNREKAVNQISYKCTSALTPKEQMKLVKLVGNKCTVNCSLDGNVTESLWDTGADVSMAGEKWLRKYTNNEIKPLSELIGEELSLSAANNTPIDYLGYAEIVFEIAGCKPKKIPFLIVHDELEMPIIGTNAIEEATKDCTDPVELSRVLSAGIKSLSKRKVDGLVNLIQQRQQNPEPDVLGDVKLNKTVVIPGGTSLKVNGISHCGPVSEDMVVLFQPNLQLDLVNSGLVVGEGIMRLNRKFV